MGKQRGMTTIGMLFIGALVAAVVIVAAKLVPSYIEFFSIKKVFAAMAQSGELKSLTPKELRASFDRRASIDQITSIKGEDLQISQEAGEATINAEYTVKVPIVGNLSACLDFAVSTGAGK
jgi:hypothetical protein